MTDFYSTLPPERGRELRRHNKERLAALMASQDERHERMARVAAAQGDRLTPPSLALVKRLTNRQPDGRFPV